MSDGTSAKYGVLMIVGFMGAFVFFILNALHPFLAIVVGGLLLFFGYGILSSAASKDKIAGLACIIAGALSVLSVLPFIKHLASWLLKAGAVVLLVIGVWSGILFVINLKNRN